MPGVNQRNSVRHCVQFLASIYASYKTPLPTTCHIHDKIDAELEHRESKLRVVRTLTRTRAKETRVFAAQRGHTGIIAVRGAIFLDEWLRSFCTVAATSALHLFGKAFQGKHNIADSKAIASAYAYFTALGIHPILTGHSMGGYKAYVFACANDTHSICFNSPLPVRIGDMVSSTQQPMSINFVSELNDCVDVVSHFSSRGTTGCTVVVRKECHHHAPLTNISATHCMKFFESNSVIPKLEEVVQSLLV